MKVGAEDKKKVIAMAVLLVIAIPLAIYSFSPSSSSAASPTPTAAAPTEPEPTMSHVTKKKASIPQMRQKTLDPTLRTDILAASQKIEYTGGSRNIFKMEDTTVIPPMAASARQQEPPHPTIVATQPPPPPQIPLKYYGFSNRAGEAKKAFLQDGDNLFVAVEGDVVERRYKIVKITNTSILVEDVLNNNQQNINLTPPQTAG